MCTAFLCHRNRVVHVISWLMMFYYNGQVSKMTTAATASKSITTSFSRTFTSLADRAVRSFYVDVSKEENEIFPLACAV